MFGNILVAIDGSPTSTHGLRTAIELAADQKARLHVVHVVDAMVVTPVLDGGYPPADYMEPMVEALRQSGRKLLARAQAKAEERGVDLRPALVEAFGGTVAHTILAHARKVHADVIVLGTHGRRGLSRVLLGSDAEAVLREARVPVMLVRKPERSGSRTIQPVSLRPIAKKRAAGAVKKHAAGTAIRAEAR